MSRSIVLFLAACVVGCTKPDDSDPIVDSEVDDTDLLDTDDTDDTEVPTDVDGDGVDAPEDCDDGDDTVYPGAPEVLKDGIDQDCDGRDAGATLFPDELLPGELVLTEFMVDPDVVADAAGEWFEITNQATNPVDLVGLQIVDLGAVTFTVTASVVLAPGDAAVVGVNANVALNGDVAVDITDAGLGLNDLIDELRLSNGVDDLDIVGWDDGFPVFPGRSLSLSPDQVDADDNDDVTAWCAGVSVYGDGDQGTPGEPNDVCPADADGDGWDVTVDCDDADAGAFPGAVEVWDDGVDQDCNGKDALAKDVDADGYEIGVDCDDADPDINPGVAEIADDGVDQDCNGKDLITGRLYIDDLVAGDLVITELMIDSSAVGDANGEWFEVSIAATAEVDLEGLVLGDLGIDSATIDEEVVVAPGDIVIFAVGADPTTNGGVSVDVVYVDVSLANGGDELVLSNAAGEIDSVAWDADWPSPTGASVILAPGWEAYADDPDSWCASRTVWAGSAGDAGSPGVPNDLCLALIDVDGDGYMADVDCNDDDATIYPGATDVPEDGLDQDCSGADAEWPDADGDGYKSNVDCDDADKTSYPGAVDKPGDGIDQDCDGADDPYPDDDGDGYKADVDCDDADKTVNPGATEVFADGIDQDCDDLDAPYGAADLAVGDLVVTEVLQNPKAVSDANGEWFEVYNASGYDLDLIGMGLKDLGTDRTTVKTSLTVKSGDWLVFGVTTDTTKNGGIAVDYAYGTAVALGNADDEVVLSYGTVTFDEIAWDGGTDWPDPDGYSMTLDPDFVDATDNDDGQAWCVATTKSASGDYGTPGAKNDECYADADGDGYKEDVDCDDTDKTVYPGATDKPGDGIDQDCSGADAPYPDADGDGYKSDVDCDETSAAINPGATDVPGDGIDQDCSGSDASFGDLDSDGYKSDVDCDDADKTVNPGATEVDGDGKDQDCDGYDAAFNVDDLAAGDLVVTEVHADPGKVSDSLGQWFEVTNTSGAAVDLKGLAFEDTDGSTFSVDVNLVIDDGGYVVFGLEDDKTKNGGVVVDFEYAGVTLDNTGSLYGFDVTSSDGAVVLDSVAWETGWPWATGTAMGVDPELTDATLNDDVDGWCAATSSFGDGDLGTPGSANDSCTSVLTVADLATGDLVITEIMANPSLAGTDTANEWFEVYNASGSAVDLDKLVVTDNVTSFTVSGALEVVSGGYVVFAAVADSTKNGGNTEVDYAYGTSSIALANGKDSIKLSYSSTTFDSVAYDTAVAGGSWPVVSAYSTSLDPDKTDATTNDTSTNWCKSTSKYATSDYGTPGAKNDEC